MCHLVATRDYANMMLKIEEVYFVEEVTDDVEEEPIDETEDTESAEEVA